MFVLLHCCHFSSTHHIFLYSCYCGKCMAKCRTNLGFITCQYSATSENNSQDTLNCPSTTLLTCFTRLKANLCQVHLQYIHRQEFTLLFKQYVAGIAVLKEVLSWLDQVWHLQGNSTIAWLRTQAVGVDIGWAVSLVGSIYSLCCLILSRTVNLSPVGNRYV